MCITAVDVYLGVKYSLGEVGVHGEVKLMMTLWANRRLQRGIVQQLLHDLTGARKQRVPQ